MLCYNCRIAGIPSGFSLIKIRFPFLCAFLFCVPGATLPARAATFSVSNLNDSGPGSLRQAVVDANSATGDDVITFAPAVRGTIALSSGELVIASNIISS